jgi:hypothetical protein
MKNGSIWRDAEELKEVMLSHHIALPAADEIKVGPIHVAIEEIPLHSPAECV